jgi:sulfate adenylyltransferase subunit 1 (EFTu-like GTPase family)
MSILQVYGSSIPQSIYCYGSRNDVCGGASCQSAAILEDATKRLQQQTTICTFMILQMNPHKMNKL